MIIGGKLGTIQNILKSDMVSGYFQCQIHEEDKHLFTFLLLDGKYRYNSTPMGASPSGDHFNIMTDVAFRGTEGMKEVADVLSQAKSVP